MDKYITYNSTSELHKELTNILLLSIEDNAGCYYCYCGEEFGTCGICSLSYFLLDPNQENLIEGIKPRKFLAKNYNKRDKLELIASKILVFLEKIEKENKECLDFLNKRYSWSLKVYSTGETLSTDLDEAVENEILDAQDYDDKYNFYIQ